MERSWRRPLAAGCDLPSLGLPVPPRKRRLRSWPKPSAGWVLRLRPVVVGSVSGLVQPVWMGAQSVMVWGEGLWCPGFPAP
jgi:hypothetical protein